MPVKCLLIRVKDCNASLKFSMDFKDAKNNVSNSKNQKCLMYSVDHNHDFDHMYYTENSK